MKKLLNTLYVTTADRYLSLEGENVVILDKGTKIGRVPLLNLENIVTWGYCGASPALMRACVKRNIGLQFLTSSGRFLARVVGEVHGNVLLRREQYRIADDSCRSLKIAQNFITGKVFNSRWVLERAIRDYPMRLDVTALREHSHFLQETLYAIQQVSDFPALRGLEGEAARVYFLVMDHLILQQKEAFYFRKRSKRPPLDRMNALLSFAYTLLAGMCTSALESVGLDPYVGFLHRDRPGRVSLALDLMEELRSVFADRFVLTLVNKKILSPNGFTIKENGAVLMDEETRKKFLSAWQSRKQEKITHPYLNEKLEWGMVPYVQAMLLARTLRGDLDEYPPLMWK